MENSKNYQNFHVALLCEDMEKAKLLSSFLRKWSIIPYVFTDLKNYKQSTIKEVPHLSLVEVTMMSDGVETLADHPKYQEGVLNCAVFCSNETIPLMAGSYEYNSIGFFNIDTTDLSSRLENLIIATQKRSEVFTENLRLKRDLHMAQDRSAKLIEKVQTNACREEYASVLSDFIEELDQKCTQLDFNNSIESVLERCEWVQRYTILEPTINGQKLISPHLKGNKFKACPSLWLGREHSTNGIKQYAQNLAHQVVQDYLGDEFVTIAIRVSGYEHPHALIYMQVDNDFRDNFDWSLFQSLVSGFYCRSLLGETLRRSPERNYVSEWEFFELINRENLNEVGLSQSKVYVLDFDRLFQTIQDYGEFHWKSFFDQFSSQLTAKLDCDFKYSILHTSFMAFHISHVDAAAFENVISSFYKKFAYWRFFEDPDQVLAKDLSPRIRILAPLYNEVTEYIGKKQNQQWQGRRKEQLEDLIDELYEVRRPISEV